MADERAQGLQCFQGVLRGTGKVKHLHRMQRDFDHKLGARIVAADHEACSHLRHKGRHQSHAETAMVIRIKPGRQTNAFISDG
jgi:hypothetical protein